MKFIDRKMYIEIETGIKFVFDEEIGVLVNRPNQLIKERHYDKFKPVYTGEFKVEDKVVVKNWDEMTDYYPVDDMGDILIPAFFTTDMKKFCGQMFRIRQVQGLGNYPIYYLKDLHGQKIHKAFTDEMLKNVESFGRF